MIATQSPLRHVRRLLLGCTGLAAAAVPQAARAQAYNASPIIVSGDVAIADGVGTSTITIRSPQAVINWIPPRGSAPPPYIFLPAGNVATYRNAAPGQNFAVLNRIVSTLQARFDGTVISRLQTQANNSVPGGTVLFQAPGGILIGSTALFDVGNLVLTTLSVVEQADPPPVLQSGSAPLGDFVELDGTIRFNPPVDPTATVTTLPGARILANGEGSWVAMIAPRVIHGGLTYVNGSTAYVAAQQVAVRVNQGLFDIVVENGTDFADAIVHTGATGGPASLGGADNHRINFVASPNATAVRMLLSGSVGYDDAVSAAIENGAIVLSAGYDINGGAVGTLSASTNANADILISGGLFTSDVTGVATRDIIAQASGSSAITFRGDVAFRGDERVLLLADGGAQLRVEGNFSGAAPNLLAFTPPPVPAGGLVPAGINVAGGEVGIAASGGGSVVILGGATLNASALGLFGDTTSPGTGTGGLVRVEGLGGTVSIGGRLAMLATGTGAIRAITPDSGGAGAGGVARINAVGGSVTVGGGLTVDVRGAGSASNGVGSPAGARGDGGDVLIQAGSGGTVTIDGGSQIDARGFGGAVSGTDLSRTGGVGDGGQIRLVAINGVIELRGASTFDASGVGGAGPNGGDGVGGTILATATGGRIAFGQALSGLTDGRGGAAAATGAGGDGLGGTIELRARSGQGSSLDAGAVDLSADGLGGGGATGGEGRGGRLVLTSQTNNAPLLFGATTALARGFGGSGSVAGGDAFGGVVLAGAETGFGAVGPGGGATYGSLTLDASGNGGAGPGGAGGDGTGGTITLAAEGSPVLFTNAALLADGFGGQGGGIGVGGSVNLRAIGATMTGTGLTGSANGFSTAATGNIAGRWSVLVDNTVMRFATLDIEALVAGGAAGPVSRIDLNGGQLDITSRGDFSASPAMQLNAQGTGSLTGGDIFFLGSRLTLSHSGRAAAGSTVAVRNLTVQVGDFFANAGTTTRASQRVAITAEAGATIADLIAAPTIQIASAAIDIAATGFLGDASTQSTTLTARVPLGQTFANQAVLGGTTEGPGWTLTNAEASRIRSAMLDIQVQQTGIAANRAPDLLIRDLALAVPAGSSGAGVNVLQVSVQGTSGIASVEGGLLLANAAASSRVVLNAAGRIEIVNPLGSVRVRDAAGAPGGTVQLASNNIWSASAALLALLRADANFAGRDAALNDNGGAQAPRGFIEGGGVTLNVRNSLFVQNSGENAGGFSLTGPAYGGITVGPAGLIIRATGTVPASVTAFGRRINADGSLTTGDPFFFAVDFQVGAQPAGLLPQAVAGSPGLAAGFTPTATFNNCVIVTGACPVRVPEDFGEPEGSEVIEGPIGGGEAIPIARPPNDDIIDSSFAAEGLIEEPVTSGGDATLWECKEEDDPRCRPIGGQQP